MFIDKVKITVKAGDGGNGKVSFHREKYVPNGGPDGGNGGAGGNIVFIADENSSALSSFRYTKKFTAENGEAGGQKRCTGKSGKDLIIKVPKGTIIKETNTGRVIADIFSEKGVIIARGGKGGAGNMNFANSVRQAPRYAKSGKPGEKFELTLELKLLADVGLLGYPNVGKSSLLRAVSAAKPEVANYHFTTLNPVLGVVAVGDASDSFSFVIADIPGLCDGASTGIGLGHQFLRHIERCRILLHIVDVSGCEGRNPIDDYIHINKELINFSNNYSDKFGNANLAELPQIVVANKIDIATNDQISEFEKFIKNDGKKFFKISAVTKTGTLELINYLAAELQKLPPPTAFETNPFTEEERKLRIQGERTYKIQKSADNFYYIEALWLNPVIANINPIDYETVQYFQNLLIEHGIIHALKEAGCKEGDTVSVNGFEFEYIE